MRAIWYRSGEDGSMLALAVDTHGLVLMFGFKIAPQDAEKMASAQLVLYFGPLTLRLHAPRFGALKAKWAEIMDSYDEEGDDSDDTR